MQSPFVRLAGLEDLEALLPLFEAQLREHEISASVDAIRDVARLVISEPRHGFILVAVGEGGVLGLAYAASHLSVEHGGIIGWLEELYVLPSLRGIGAGSCLLRETVTHARQLGWRGIQLEVVEGHERVLPLYLRHEFQPLGRTLFCRIFPQ